MSTYMSFFSYTKDAWRGMVQHPEDRQEAARSVIEAAGGTLRGFWWMLGEDDGVAIFEVPNATCAAAVSAATSASGRIETVRTVHLLDSVEVKSALELAKVAGAAYRPPGGLLQDWRAGYDELGK